MRNEQGAMGNAALPAPSNGQTVYKYFQKWQCKGIWQVIHDELRGKLREVLRREANSCITIADSQSVKTTEKRGQSAVLMAVRRLKAVSATSQSIPRGLSGRY